MRLDHLDLPSPDPAATMDFFVRHLGFTVFYRRADGLVVGEDDHGTVLAVSPLPQGAQLGWPRGFHVGCVLESDDAVRAAHERLRMAGAPVRMAPQVLGGALTCQFEAPGGIPVELTARR